MQTALSFFLPFFCFVGRGGLYLFLGFFLFCSYLGLRFVFLSVELESIFLFLFSLPLYSVCLVVSFLVIYVTYVTYVTYSFSFSFFF